MMHGIDAVRRTSDNVTRQSLKAIEGLSSQADLLKNVSENLLQQMSGVTNRFDNQGQSIVHAASALEIGQLAHRLHPAEAPRRAQRHPAAPVRQGRPARPGHARLLADGGGHDGRRGSARPQLIQQLAQGTLAHAQAAGAELERLRSQTDAHSQAVVAEFERLREQTDAQATRALEDMRAKVSGVSQEVTQHLGSMASRFNETSDDLRSQAARATASLQAEHERLRAEAQRLPAATRESTDSHARRRSTISCAPSTRPPTTCARRRRARRPRMQAEQERMRAEAERLPIATRESAEPCARRSTTSCARWSSSPACPPRERRDVTPPGPPPRGSAAGAAGRAYRRTRPGAPPPPPPVQADSGGERWSLGDLLARASRDDDGVARAPVLNLQSIARALDPTTASAIWSRFRAGQRGIMVRSIYTNEGRTSSTRSASATAGRRLPPHRRPLPGRLRAAGARHRAERPAGAVHDHLVSDSGRVYLFLAHASGRLR